MASTVLVVTTLEDVTADMVIEALNEREIAVARVDPADIGPELTFSARIGPGALAWQGRLRTTSRVVELDHIAAVYYRRPSPWRFDHLPRQEQEFATAEARHGLGGILASLRGALYVNHPAAVARADFKPTQLDRFAALGLAVPPTLVGNDFEEARAFAIEHAPVVYKTFRGLPPSVDGHTGAIWTQRVDPATFDDTLAVTAQLFQAEIPKIADARVTVVGRRVFAQRIGSRDDGLDWRRIHPEHLTHAQISVPTPIVARLHRYLASFGLAFGCFDFALTGDGDHIGDWIVLECNPNGQWGWLPDAAEIAEAFAELLQEGVVSRGTNPS